MTTFDGEQMKDWRFQFWLWWYRLTVRGWADDGSA